MKNIFLNLKRFDVVPEMGGVNRIADPEDWGTFIINCIQNKLHINELEIGIFFPEAYILDACRARDKNNNIKIGCQGVYREDIVKGGNFGAFTTNRTASAMKGIGCTTTIIGHCEERKDKLEIMKAAGSADVSAVNTILNKEVRCAVNQGMEVLYCVGETAEEQHMWKEVLDQQIRIGLEGVDRKGVIIAYEPVWAIGPGKTPPDKEYITKVVSYLKEITEGMKVVYGGGLKKENTAMLKSIQELDGGLIALTRFQDDFGFYPDEFLEIVKDYIGEECVKSS